MFLLLFFLAFHMPKVDAGIPYAEAALAWYPYEAPLKVVRWCHPQECDGYGGGLYKPETEEILIDPDYDYPVEDGILLTLEHETGHSLGLPHNDHIDSIMRSGWDAPVVQGPTKLDFANLRALHAGDTKHVVAVSRGSGTGEHISILH